MMDEMYDIMIVEDEKPARELIIDLVLSRQELHLKAIAKDGKEALEKIKNENFDLVFFDIHLPYYTAIEILTGLQKYPRIIFTTAYVDYAIHAFEFDAVDYLIKPFTRERFNLAVDKFLKLNKKQKKTPYKKPTTGHFSFRMDNKQYILSFRKIIYLTSNGKTTVIHTDDHDYEISGILKQIEANLPQEIFCRIHKKHIVNIKYLLNIEYNQGGRYRIYLNDYQDTNLPVGRNFIEKLSEKLQNI